MILTGDFDEVTGVKLSPIAPSTLSITPVDPTVQVPNTAQFSASATFAEVSGEQDVTSKVTWVSSDMDKGTINNAGLFTPVHVGSTDITASLSNVTSNTSTVSVVAGAPNTNNSLVAADPTANVTVSDDGSAYSTVTITVKDANGNAVSGQTVNITLTGTGNYINGTAYTIPVDLETVTNASGVVTFQLSSTKAETKTVTAKVGATTIASVDVAFTAAAFSAGSSTVESSAASVTTDGGATATITVTLKDAFDNPVSGQSVTLSADGSDNTYGQPSATDVNGQTSGTIASTKAEAKTVTAKVETATVGTVSVTFTPGVATKFSVEAVKTTLASQGKGTTTVTATIKDDHGNTVTTDNGRAVDFSVATGTYLKVDSASDTTENGLAQITITTQGNAVPEGVTTTDTVTATSAGLTPDPGNVVITIVNFSILVDAPAAPYYNQLTGVNLVNSASTPYTATFTGAGSNTGDYRWELTGVGSISSTTADTVTYTAPVSIALGEGETFKKDTLTLTDVNDPDTLNDAIDIYIYKPLVVTWPTEAIGIAKGDTTQGITVTGGTGTYKFQSDDTLKATVNEDTGAITPVAVGFCHIQVRDASYGTFAAGEGFDAESLQIEIVEPITVTPATKSVDASGSQAFAASGGKEADGYTWTCSNPDAGTIDATTGLFTAAAVTDPQTATITATDGYGIVGTATVTVYPGMVISETPTGYVDGTPSTYPLLKLGETTTLSAADTSRTYDWTITDWNDGQIGATVTATSLTVDPDALFAASGAGIYTVTLVDQNNPGLAPTTLKVRVPMKFVATKFAGAAVKDAGSYYDNQGTDTYTVTGGPASAVYNYSALDLNGVEVTEAACGVFTDLIATDADNVFNFTAGIDVMASFRVKVALDKDQYDTDSDVKRLVDAELDELWSGIFRVIPQLTYTGKLVDSDINPVAGAVVTCTSDTAKTATTDALGEFKITGLAKTGVVYKFFIWKDGYINKIVTGDEIEAGNIVLEALGNGSGAIDGTVTLTGDPVPYASGTVAIQAKTAAGGYIKDGDGNIITVLASPSDGSYSFPVPAEYAATGPYTVEFKKAGYIFNEDAGLGVLTNIALNDPNADISLNPVTIVTVTGIPEDSDADLQNDQVLVKITAEAGLIPFKFDGTATEISVLDDNGEAVVLDVFAVEGANTWSFTHSGYENFTITINGDVSDDRDVDTDYKATTTWTYVKSATAPTPTVIADPNVDGGTASSATGDTDVNLPPGGLTGDILSNVTLTIVEADATDAGAATITGSEIVEVVMTDDSGEKVDNTNIQRIEITMKFDPTVVTSGTLEAGTYVIYQANTLADIVAGSATAIPAAQIILPIDYVNGYVTFWVNHLSAFGIGGASSSSGVSLTDSSSDSRCFIATAAYGSPFEKHVSILRQFRDVFLMPTKLGHAFVQAYYEYSPKAAAFIADHDSLRAMVRVALLPAVGVSYMMLHFGLIATLAAFAAFAALLAFAAFRIRRTRLNN